MTTKEGFTRDSFSKHQIGLSTHSSDQVLVEESTGKSNPWSKPIMQLTTSMIKPKSTAFQTIIAQKLKQKLQTNDSRAHTEQKVLSILMICTSSKQRLK